MAQAAQLSSRFISELLEKARGGSTVVEHTIAYPENQEFKSSHP
jgi:hypothetical protein